MGEILEISKFVVKRMISNAHCADVGRPNPESSKLILNGDTGQKRSVFLYFQSFR